MLVTKPFYEKGTGVILPQCDGPFTIARVLSAHTVTLADTLTGEPVFQSKPVSIARLIRFNYPQQYAGPEALADETVRSDFFEELKTGDFVACSPRTSAFDRVYLGRVLRVFRDQELIEAALFHVAPGSRTGPWQARVWTPLLRPDESPHVEVMSRNEIISDVELSGGALTHASLEKLVAAGIPAGLIPRRDATLPRADLAGSLTSGT